MSDKNFSSAKKDISIKGGALPKVDAKAILGNLNKDVKKRWMMVGLTTAAGLWVVSAWVSSASQDKPAVPQKEESVVETSPKGISSNKDWKTQTGADLLELRRNLERSQAAQRELLARVEALSQDVKKGAVAQAQAPAGNSGLNLTLPPPPTPPSSLTPPPAPPPTASLPATAPSPSAGSKPVTAEPVVKRAPARSFFPGDFDPKTSAQAERVVDEMVPNDRNGYLPAGSFAASTMISGVEAFTGGTAQSQPQPIVLRLDANAVLPNAAKYQIKGCHVLASVWGDMSSERVFGRLATLTCVDTANKLVLSEDVEGVLVDSDGKNGIRGSLQDRQGAKLARSLLAGFAQGVSAAFGAAQSTTQTTALGLTTSLIGQNAAKAGAYNGASTASQQLADFYLKQAEATMPVIAVDAGRKVSVLFTKSKALKFETTDNYRVQPKSKLMVERAVN